MRQKKLAILGLLMCSAVLFFAPSATAKIIDEASYQYPYRDPYLATTTVALMTGSENPSTAEIKDLRLKILENRNDIDLLEGKGLLRYRFYRQPGPAPLIFVVPGLAGSAYTGPVRFLAEWLSEHGFHVLILPSPLNWNFALAASSSGTPGHRQDDTRDLYRAMRLVLNEVKNHHDAQISKIGVLGLSDGALYSAYLSKMDAENGQIGIETFLLVNPPVDLFEAIREIDKMADIGKDYAAKQKKSLEAYAQGVVAEALGRDSSDPAYFMDWDRRLKLNDKQMKYLIGKSMRDAVGDSIYAIDLANDREVLKAPISWGMRSARMEEAHAYSLMDYVGTFVIPRMQRSGYENLSLKELDTLNSIRGIASEIKDNRSVFLMHNLDDILVSRNDIAYLQKVFGDRATIYPRGGHLGNLWYQDNKKHIAQIFRPLLQGAETANP